MQKTYGKGVSDTESWKVKWYGDVNMSMNYCEKEMT
jgi:hypothetical protein